MSRDHSIRTDRLPGSNAPVHSLIGEWTTFRGFAAEAADRVLGDLGRRRTTSTELAPIGGGRDYPVTADQRGAFVQKLAATGLSSIRAESLLDRYGTRAAEVAAWCAVRQDAPLPSLPDYSRAEIGFILVNEIVGRLADLVFRRTDIALAGRLTPAVVSDLADVGAEVLGWDAARRAEEVAEVARIAASRHGMAAVFRRLPTEPGLAG